MLILAFLVFTLTGCTALLLNDTDSTALKTGKIAARTLIALPTIFTSELVMSDLASERDYARWYHSLSPEERAREEARAPRMMLLLSPPSFTPYQIPQAHSVHAPPASTLAAPVTCQHSVMGTAVTTTCY